MRIKAYAKVNLRLKVLGKCPNSYHLLQMVNTKIGLYDVLKIKKIKEQSIEVLMDGVSKENNLIYKVACRMFELYNLPGGLHIEVIKNIPLAAGLAGGSADAAATINAINKMYKLNLNIETLRTIALEFGTDIVYCLENKQSLVFGIGEKIEHLQRNIKSDILIVNPGFSVFTRDIFELYDNNGKYSESLTKEKIELLDLNNLLSNDLEDIVFDKYPQLENLKLDILKENKIKVIMTGTGPTLFVLGNKRSLKKIYNKYKNKDYFLYLTKIINK